MPKKLTKKWPIREEWDFGQLKEGYEQDCWYYEFGRECDWIRHRFATDQKQKRMVEVRLGSDLNGFDAGGYWYMARFMSWPGKPEEANDWISFIVPPGFPDTPFLKLALACPINELKRELIAGGATPVVDIADFYGENGMPLPVLMSIKTHSFRISWECHDDELLNGFKIWLKQHRPFKPTEQRGRRLPTILRADLKALGATRLLRAGTATEAMDYTEKLLSMPIYSKESDWYAAKSRVSELLERRFQHNWKDPSTTKA